MNKVLRGAAVVAAAGLAVPLWAVPTASAAVVQEPASIGAYFYSAGIDKPEESPTQPPNVTADTTDGVAPGHLAVAVRTPNQVDKMSFLFFDLLSVPFDATINKAAITVPLAEPTPPLTDPRQANVQRSPAPEKVRVCAAGPEGFNGEDGASFASAPAVDCEAFSSAPGKATADGKAYTFEITALAASWLTSANNGLALVPAEEALSSSFQVVFQPNDQATIAAEFTAPPAADLGSSTDFGTDTATPPSFESFTTTTGGDAGTFDTGASFDTGDSGFGSVEAPAIDTALPEAAPEEAAPAPDVAPSTTVRNVAAATDAPLTPSLGFWLGLLALAGLLGFLGLIMGDARIPAPVAAAPSRLTRALQDRQRGGRLGRPLSI